MDYRDPMPHAKLTEADIPEIRQRRRTGEALASIGDSYGVSFNAIREAALGLSWRHVPGP